MFFRASRKSRPLLPKTRLRGEPSRTKGKKVQKPKLDKYVCQACSKEFTRVSRYENHIRLHTGEFPFDCSTCGKRFRSAERLSAHRATHAKLRFQCGLCSGKFTTLHELRKHQRLTKLAISGGEPNDHVPVKCKLCNFEIASRSAGRQHLRSHSSGRKRQRPYVCSNCKACFSQLSQLGQHERTQHCQTSDTSRDCPKCRHVFRMEGDPEQDVPCRLRHIHQIHSYSRTTHLHACHVCGKKFRSSSCLGKHLATHFDFDLYKCDSCRMEFADEQSLNEHHCSKRLEPPAKPILVVKFLAPPDCAATRAIMVQPMGTSDSTYGEPTNHQA